MPWKSPPRLLVVAEIVVLLAGVVSRFVFRHPFVWSDELASILFLWLAMFGAVVALQRERAHAADRHRRRPAAGLAGAGRGAGDRRCRRCSCCWCCRRRATTPGTSGSSRRRRWAGRTSCRAARDSGRPGADGLHLRHPAAAAAVARRDFRGRGVGFRRGAGSGSGRWRCRPSATGTCCFLRWPAGGRGAARRADRLRLRRGDAGLPDVCRRMCR